MINPFTCYILSFSTALIVYFLGWSEVYPELKWPLIVFLLATIIIHLVLSVLWSKSSKHFDKPVATINPAYVTIFLYSLWMVEFIYEGGIPLLKILLAIPFDYKLFGVPSLHVFVVTLSSFYTIYLFDLFVEHRHRKYLYFYLINLAAAILIYNRGMLFFNLAGTLFIYLFSPSAHISIKKVLLILPGLLIWFYVFGVLGNLRTSFESGQRYNPEIFLDTGHATESFRESMVPKEYFWSYIYMTSPIANLQNNIDHHQLPELTGSRFFDLVNNEFLFDAVSKRVNAFLGRERLVEYRYNWPFNVSTVYSRSYTYFGWPGMILICLMVLVLPFIYLKLLPSNNSQYNRTAIALLCVMYMFLVFDNTIRFTGLAFQLVYPFVFVYVDRLKFKFAI